MPDNRLIVRDARSDELDAISRLLEQSYAEYRKFFPADVWEAYLADMADVRGRLKEAELIIAELDGRLAGTVTLYLKQSYLASWPRDWAGVRLLGVHPAFRGKGVARALMEECIRRCREKGVATLGLHTGEFMKVARAMYEKMGFVRVPEFDFHPAPDHVVLAYRLQL